MKLLFFSLVSLIVASGCVSAERAAVTDYSVAAGQALPNELERAQERANHYFTRLSSAQREKLTQYEALAIIALELPVSDVQGLAHQMANGKYGYGTTNAYDRISGRVKFIMLVDPKTGQITNHEGYISIMTPHKGTVGIFGGNTALYIGDGR